jgi:hypothetical protein
MGETANQQQKVSNPPPEANLVVGFLVLALTKMATARKSEGAAPMNSQNYRGNSSAEGAA